MSRFFGAGWRIGVNWLRPTSALRSVASSAASGLVRFRCQAHDPPMGLIRNIAIQELHVLFFQNFLAQFD